jgi:Tfp pilus assembly ATPase PilU
MITISNHDDIHLIYCALSAYYERVHHANSDRKNVARLINMFSEDQTEEMKYDL